MTIVDRAIEAAMWAAGLLGAGYLSLLILGLI